MKMKRNGLNRKPTWMSVVSILLALVALVYNYSVLRGIQADLYMSGLGLLYGMLTIAVCGIPSLIFSVIALRKRDFYGWFGLIILSVAILCYALSSNHLSFQRQEYIDKGNKAFVELDQNRYNVSSSYRKIVAYAPSILPEGAVKELPYYEPTYRRIIQPFQLNGQIAYQVTSSIDSYRYESLCTRNPRCTIVGNASMGGAVHYISITKDNMTYDTFFINVGPTYVEVQVNKTVREYSRDEVIAWINSLQQIN